MATLLQLQSQFFTQRLLPTLVFVSQTDLHLLVCLRDYYCGCLPHFLFVLHMKHTKVEISMDDKIFRKTCQRNLHIKNQCTINVEQMISKQRELQ